MKTNKDLTVSEFLCAQNVKRAMVFSDDIEKVKKYLSIALEELYR